jgi:hypothetical protein
MMTSSQQSGGGRNLSAWGECLALAAKESHILRGAVMAGLVPAIHAGTWMSLAKLLRVAPQRYGPRQALALREGADG